MPCWWSVALAAVHAGMRVAAEEERARRQAVDRVRGLTRPVDELALEERLAGGLVLVDRHVVGNAPVEVGEVDRERLVGGRGEALLVELAVERRDRQLRAVGAAGAARRLRLNRGCQRPATGQDQHRDGRHHRQPQVHAVRASPHQLNLGQSAGGACVKSTAVIVLPMTGGGVSWGRSKYMVQRITCSLPLLNAMWR